MNMIKSTSAKAAENVEKLKEWIQETPLAKIPLNQFGKSAKQQICEELGIPRSTIGSNADLKSAFDHLDMVLSKKKNSPEPQSSSKSSLGQRQIAMALQSANSILTDNNQTQAKKLARLTYLENFGFLLNVLP